MTRGRIRLRGRIWWVYYYYKGRERAESTRSTDKKAAELLLAKRLGEIGADQAGVRRWLGPDAERTPVTTLLDDLMRAYEIEGSRSIHLAESRMKPLRASFDREIVREVDTARLRRYIQSRREQGRAPATIKVELSFLHRAFALALREGRIGSIPPFPEIKVENARQGFFEQADLEAVAVHLPAYLQDVVRFAYLTGWRKQEIIGLTWAEIDLAGRVARLAPTRSKNKRGRVLPLEGDLWEIVQRRGSQRVYKGMIVPYVFHYRGQRIASIDYAWHRACEKAGVRGMVFHDLRRSAVRNLIRAGVSQHIAMQVTGHQTASVFHRYDIVVEEDIRQAQEKVQRYLEASKEEGRKIVPIVPLGG